MGKFFAETIEEQEVQSPQRSQVHIGFDPDLHRSGLALVEVQLGPLGRKRILSVTTKSLTVSRRLHGVVAAMGMIEQIQIRSEFFVGDYAWVESQQVYYANDQRSRIVAVANDLLHLATISGAAVATLIRRQVPVQLLIPAQWKGQVRKENMHRRLLEVLEKEGILLDKVTSHELDAICLAMTGAGYAF